MNLDEIKYRVWCREFEEYDYTTVPANLLQAIHEDELVEEDYKIYSIERFVRYYDCRDNPIYAGDLVHLELNGQNHICEVCDGSEYPYFFTVVDGKNLIIPFYNTVRYFNGEYMVADCVVIGNIHENKNLMPWR